MLDQRYNKSLQFLKENINNNEIQQEICNTTLYKVNSVFVEQKEFIYVFYKKSVLINKQQDIFNNNVQAIESLNSKKFLKFIGFLYLQDSSDDFIGVYFFKSFGVQIKQIYLNIEQKKLQQNYSIQQANKLFIKSVQIVSYLQKHVNFQDIILTCDNFFLKEENNVKNSVQIKILPFNLISHYTVNLAQYTLLANEIFATIQNHQIHKSNLFLCAMQCLRLMKGSLPLSAEIRQKEFNVQQMEQDNLLDSFDSQQQQQQQLTVNNHQLAINNNILFDEVKTLSIGIKNIPENQKILSFLESLKNSIHFDYNRRSTVGEILINLKFPNKVKQYEESLEKKNKTIQDLENLLYQQKSGSGTSLSNSNIRKTELQQITNQSNQYKGFIEQLEERNIEQQSQIQLLSEGIKSAQKIMKNNLELHTQFELFLQEAGISQQIPFLRQSSDNKQKVRDRDSLQQSQGQQNDSDEEEKKQLIQPELQIQQQKSLFDDFSYQNVALINNQNAQGFISSDSLQGIKQTLQEDQDSESISQQDLRNSGFIIKFQDKESQGIQCLAIIDQDTIATGGNDKQIKLWKWKLGQCQLKLIGHSHPISCLCLIKNNKILASGSSTENFCSIKVWDIESGICLKTLLGHKDSISQIISINEEIMASCSYDSTIIIWNLKQGKSIKVLYGHQLPVLTLCQLSEERMIASGSDDCTIRIWNWQENLCTNIIIDIISSVTCLKYLDKGNILLVGCGDGSLKIWNFQVEQFTAMFQMHERNIISINYCEQLDLIITCGQDQYICYLNLNEKKITDSNTSQWHNDSLSALCQFQDSQSLIVSASYDSSFIIWNLKQEFEKKSLSLMDSEIK